MCCTHSRSSLEGMSRSLLWGPGARILVGTTHPFVCVVFGPREPPRRAHRLSIRRGVVVTIIVVLLLPRLVRVIPAPAPAIDHSTARRVCGWMPGDDRERHAAACMLQDSRLALHV
jgi:hypothetical protein